MATLVRAGAAVCAALAVVILCTPIRAATLSQLTSFGSFGDGWIAPGERTYLTTDNTQRGIAWNPTTGNLLLVNRSGSLSIKILDGMTGADVTSLNLGSGVISGGTFAGSMIGVADDGAIYMSNLTVDTNASAYKVYRWANEGATPVVAYSGNALPGARIGDTLDVIGSGVNTRLVAGYSSAPAISGNNSFALFTTANGTSFTSTHVAVASNPPVGGDFRLGIAFQDGDTVIGKQATNGRIVDVTGGTGTLNASFVLGGILINVMDFAVVGGVPLLAAVNTDPAGDSRLFVYDMTNPALPVQIATSSHVDVLPASTSPNSNATGQVKFGAINGGDAIIYALNTNNGIQAFQLLGVPEPAGPVALAVSALLTLFRHRPGRRGR